MNGPPLSRDVVLIGGGHCHALVLKRWAMRPMPGARLTMINPGPTAPYTGMLPGYVAGHYTREEIEIDLVRLCHHAGARLILGAVDGIDLASQTLSVRGRPPVAYDIAAIDIGVHSSLDTLPGFTEYAVPAKPLSRLAERWSRHLRDRAEGDIAVLGGGVAGVELALAVNHRLRAEGIEGRVRIVERDHVLAGADTRMRGKLLAALARNGIEIIEEAEAVAVTPEGVTLASGETCPAVLTIGATGARPWGWLTETGLPLENGYIPVGADLGVEGHSTLFAAGDCAHLTHAPRPKAGVYAVRAAPVLATNIEADLYGKPRRTFRPQRDFLKLVSLGGKRAVGHRGAIAFEGDWAWAWKNRIDRRFMEKFTTFPAMSAPQPDRPPILSSRGHGTMVCAGCGGKVGAGVLESVLSAPSTDTRTDVSVPPGDDAAVITLGDKQQVFTTDHIRAFDEDPVRVARIAALHALGDVLAMGGAPQAALAQITLPALTPDLQERWLAEINAAASAVFAKAGAALAGGHTAAGAELIIGFSVTGLLDSLPITLGGARPGDALILTRPIGSGTLLRGAMEGRASGKHIAALYGTLETPQFNAARALKSAHAMTDVTGFGLAGHAFKMARASGVTIEIDADAVPLFDGAAALAAQGVRSSLFAENRALLPELSGTDPRTALLFDPQTAGGFLAALAPDDAERITKDTGAAQIGRVCEGPPLLRLR